MAKKKKIGAKKGFWQKEAELFRRLNPKAYKESRKRAKLARLLSGEHSRHCKIRRSVAIQWNKIEHHLLQGKKGQQNLLRLVSRHHESVRNSIEAEKSFFEKRHELIKQIFGRKDWKAIDRINVLSELMLERNLETNFFSQAERLAREGMLEKFAELVTRLKLGNDPKYFNLREQIAHGGRGIMDQRARNVFADQLMGTKVNEKEMAPEEAMRQHMVGEYAVTWQEYEFMKTEARLYAHLFEQAKDPNLKGTLNKMWDRSNERAKMLYVHLDAIEESIRNPERE